jgi:hypothetical protein
MYAKPQSHYNVYNSFPDVSFLSQINPAHTLSPYLFNLFEPGLNGWCDVIYE